MNLMIVVMIVSVVAMLFEYRALKRQNRYREMVISTSLLTMGVALGILVYINVAVQSPLVIINGVFKPINQYVVRLLS
jgi:ABC-type tungstate transport system substrate-binding protein